VHEGGSKFSLSLTSSSSKPPQPTAVISVPGGGINDVAVCPSPSGFIAGERCPKLGCPGTSSLNAGLIKRGAPVVHQAGCPGAGSLNAYLCVRARVVYTST